MKKASAFLALLLAIPFISGCSAIESFLNKIDNAQMEERQKIREEERILAMQKRAEERERFLNTYAKQTEEALDRVAPVIRRLLDEKPFSYDRKEVLDLLADFTSAERFGELAWGVSPLGKYEKEGELLKFNIGDMNIVITTQAYHWRREAHMLQYKVIPVYMRVDFGRRDGYPVILYQLNSDNGNIEFFGAYEQSLLSRVPISEWRDERYINMFAITHSSTESMVYNYQKNLKLGEKDENNLREFADYILYSFAEKRKTELTKRLDSYNKAVEAIKSATQKNKEDIDKIR